MIDEIRDKIRWHLFDFDKEKVMRYVFGDKPSKSYLPSLFSMSDWPTYHQEQILRDLKYRPDRIRGREKKFEGYTGDHTFMYAFNKKNHAGRWVISYVYKAFELKSIEVTDNTLGSVKVIKRS